jgi:hypothetical protein
MLQGSTLLAEWIERRSFKRQKDAAAFLAISEGLLSMLLSGTRRPGRDLSVRIQEATGIPVSAWVVKSKSQTRKRAPKRKPQVHDFQTVNHNA